MQFQWGTFRGRTSVSLLHVIRFLAWFLCAFPAEIMSNSVFSVISRFVEEYRSSTPNKLKMIDAYLLYILLTGVFQFLYCVLVGTFPFNSFLSGFISCVGSFILAVCLRIQINPQNKRDFLTVSPERAFADFLFAHTVLHLVVVNFVG
uniref:Dolichyl-diphosphooligosaccharide--protein glycosyltransferase subunit DAD1 n=5 Tax=Cyprininae TaxID=2743694 RepID=A0A8C2HXD7_CYPCA